jgi:serine/threonine protein kinase HipA of HipAB toxin-antitoxin module
MARTTVANQLASIRKQRELLDKKEQALKSKSHEKVLAQIVNMAKEAGLSAADIAKALNSGKPAKAAKAPKVAKKAHWLARKWLLNTKTHPTQTKPGLAVACHQLGCKL